MVSISRDDERLPDLVLTIHIDRPTPEDPEGYIGMTVKEKNADRMEDASDGPHDQATMTRVLHDVQNYFANGCGSWVQRIRREDRPGHQL